MSNPLTLVSAYWNIKNKHDNKYNEWFKNTLAINCPMVFYCNNDTIDYIKQFRKDYPTHYLVHDISNFYTFKYYNNIETNPIDCPSKELNLIWNEKIFMINYATQINIFNSEYFMWYDAGHCIYRNKMPLQIPFPNINTLSKMPKNKFIFTTSDKEHYDETKVGQFYHYISGTAYLIHKSFVKDFTNIYLKYIDMCLSKKSWIYTDQVILTIMYKEHKDLFYEYGYGYGELARLLF